MHVADREHAARLAHGEEDPRALAVPVVVEIPAVLAGDARLRASRPPVATPTTPTIGLAGNDTRSFIRTIPSRTSNSRVSGACDPAVELPEAGNQRRDAPLDRSDVEDLGHERVAGLRAAHRDRARSRC